MKDFPLRAYEVVLSNGETIIVHEPGTPEEFGVFLNALPALGALGEAMENAKKAQQGILGLPTDVPPTILDGIFPLFAVMTQWKDSGKPLTVEEFKQIPPLQGSWAVLTALGQFMPGNLKEASKESPTSTP